MAITITAAAAALNRHCVTYSKDITQKIRQEVVTEMEWSPRVVDKAYATANLSGGSVVQPFQCDFTPKLNVNFDGSLFLLKALKVDIQFTCEDLEVWFDKWRCDWYEMGKPVSEWAFPRYIYDNWVVPQIAEDLELLISYKGVEAAVTAGTPGLPQQSVDGMGQVIAAAITSGHIPAANVIDLDGAFTPATYYDKLKAFNEGLPVQHRTRTGVIYMSTSHALGLAADIYEKFGNTGCCDMSIFQNGLTNRLLNVALPMINKRVVGLPSMEGRNRIIYSGVPNNLIWGRKRGEAQYPTIRWQEFDRTLKGMAEFHRFYGVENFAELYVNEVV